MKKQKIFTFALVLALLVVVVAPFSALLTNAAGIDKTSTDAQYIGYGFDVTSGALKKSNLQDIKPILNLNSDIYDYVFVKDVNENESGNIVAYSAQEIAEQVGSAYSAGINGRIKVVTLDIGTSFDKSKQVSTAVQERYELYYYSVIRKTMVIQLDASQLRNYLSPDFQSELYAVKNVEQAEALLTKYGTHLITGYNLGGRMEATNYQCKSSVKTAWASNTSLSEQIGASVSAASAGQSFSMTQQYAQGYNSSTESSSYKYTALGGEAVEALTIDQLFTYNSSLVDGKGNYIYGRWLYSVNHGENLDIIGIAKGGQAIPLWEFLPTSSEYNMIRRYLISAYVEKCGDKYTEYCNKYKTLYANITDENETSSGNIDITGFYSMTSGGVVTSTTFGSADTYSTVVPDTTVIMTYDNTTTVTDDVVWSVKDGSSYASVTDSRNGSFKVASGAKGKSFTIAVTVNGDEKATWTFKIEDCLYTCGSGEITDDKYDPYVISTVEDLRQLMLNPDDWSKSFVLADDINLSSTDVGTWSTIGTSATPFTGTFDGNYCTISGFNKAGDTSSSVGLFGVIDGGTVKNLRMSDCSVWLSNANSGVYVGILAGTNSGTISNCVVNNPTVLVEYAFQSGASVGTELWITNSCGAIVGKNNGTLSECGVINPHISAQADMSAVSTDRSDIPVTYVLCSAGGAVGTADGGTYEYCYVKTTTSGNNVSTIKTYVRGESHKNKVAFVTTGTTSSTQAFAYSGGFIGYATNPATLNECIIDLPNVIQAERNTCNEDKSYAFSGTVVGAIQSGSESDITRTKVFAHSIRQTPTATTTSGIIATTVDGAGNATFAESAGYFKILTSDIKMSDSNLSNSLGSKNSKWCGEGNLSSGFPVLKSFAFTGLGVNTDNAKTSYYYGQSYTPSGLAVSVVSAYGKGTETELKVYKINNSAFKSQAIYANGYNIIVSLGSSTGTYKATVNKCNIESITAKDVSTDKIYVGDTYSKDNRDIQITAVLSNGTKIDPITSNSLSYVNYPTDTYTVSSDTLVYGKNKVTLTYAGKTYDYLIECDENELLSIELIAQPSKVNYITGSTFAPDGMKVQATYEDGTVEEVDNSELELIGTTIADGENDILVTYGAYVTTSEPVKVYGFESMTVATMPSKTEYYVGDTIDFTGLTVNYTADGTTVETLDATQLTYSQTTIDKIGDNEITVKYGEHSVTIVLTGKEQDKQYTVTWVVDGKTTAETYTYGETPAFKGTTAKASDKAYTYTFKGWDKAIASVSEDVKYTAQYEKTAIEYTVTWVVDGKTTAETYTYGETPAFKGTTAKASDKAYTYTFKGWDKAIASVSEDVKYTAQYEKTAIEYTVTWVVDGKTTAETYTYGETPAFKGTTAKASDKAYTYTFKGWDKAIASVSEDVKYTAQYEKTAIEYTVIFYDWDNTVLLKKTDYHYGDTVALPLNPSRTDFTFIGWSPVVRLVEGNVNYIATYRSGTIKYVTVTWIVGNETVTEEYEAGEIPAYKKSTEKASDNTYRYTFSGWDKNLTALTANTVFTAQYTKQYIEYTVVFRDSDGTILSVKRDYHYGDVVTSPTVTARDGYRFIGWNQSVTMVSGNADYTAQYEQIEYTVAFYGKDGQLISAVKCHYGDVVTTPSAPQVEGYEFKGWSPSVAIVKEDVSYQAQYEKVEQVTEPKKEAETQNPTEKSTTGENTSEKTSGGCSGTIGMPTVLIIMVVSLGVGFIAKKKKHD